MSIVLALKSKDAIDWIKKKIRTSCLLSTRNSPHRHRHTWAESERIENDIPSKCNLKVNSSSYIHT
jgi:hypothetical protein